MNEKIDLTKILKDCPNGMELNCLMYEDVYFDYVDELNIIHCYIQHETHRTSLTFNQHGTPNSDIKSKCVIFPKGKTSWEGFQRPFVDGDIVATENGYFIGIIKVKNNVSFETYCAINDVGSLTINAPYYFARFATEKEKQKLFDVIKSNGFKWNAETKTLEKVLEENKIFKNSDIIVSTFGNIAIFSHTKKNGTGQNVVYYHCLYSEKPIIKFKVLVDCGIGYVEDCRLATEHEKKLMMEAIREYGYKWNKETKTLEKLIVPKFKVGDKIKHKIHIIKENIVTEIKDTHYILDDELSLPFINQDNHELLPNKFDPKTLKPFDKVLVRYNSESNWCVAFFSHIDNDLKTFCCKFVTAGHMSFKQMIPYNEETKHLLGTNEQAPEFYIY